MAANAELTPESTTVAARRPGVRKDSAIQSLRGLAVILMVSGHVIGPSAGRGIRVADDSLWRLFYLALTDIRMPLFTVISGFVYAMRPVGEFAEMPQLLKAKTRRLLFPMVTVGTLMFFSQLYVPGVNEKPQPNEYWRLFFFGYEHLWFLQSIFIIFVVIGLLDACGVLHSKSGVLLTLAVSVVVDEFVPIPLNVFSVSEAIRLIPFFLLGYILNYHSPDKRSVGKLFAVAVPVLVLSYSLRVTAILGDWHPGNHVSSAISIAVGLSAILLIMLSRNYLQSRLLAWIGGFAFAIYLFHPFFASAARIGFERVGVTPTSLIFAVGLAFGVGGPIVFQLLTSRSRLIQTGLLGEKWTTRRAQKGN